MDQNEFDTLKVGEIVRYKRHDVHWIGKIIEKSIHSTKCEKIRVLKWNDGCSFQWRWSDPEYYSREEVKTKFTFLSKNGEKLTAEVKHVI